MRLLVTCGSLKRCIDIGESLTLEEVKTSLARHFKVSTKISNVKLFVQKEFEITDDFRCRDYDHIEFVVSDDDADEFTSILEVNSLIEEEKSDKMSLMSQISTTKLEPKTNSQKQSRITKCDDESTP